MLNKMLRIWNTIRYMKPVQLYYQTKYRLFGYRRPQNIRDYESKDNLQLLIPALDMKREYIERFLPDRLLENKLLLLHMEVLWKRGKWYYKQENHLWNFNLHYFEFGIALGAKYQETSDERYYQKFKELYSDWMMCNKGYRGDGWHPYTISLRVINLFIIMELFEGKLALDLEFYEDLKKSITVQYQFLLFNQERNLSGNHYFENIKTIYLCSLYFNDTKNQAKYSGVMMKLLKEQILQDGMHYEGSFMYHRIILEGLLRIITALQALELQERDFYNEILMYAKKMSICINSFEKNMGKIPLFNDAGEGVAKDADSIAEAVRIKIGVPLKEITSLPCAGYYKLENKVFSIIFDAGRIGPDHIPGHGQCDALSFELSVHKRPIIVNSGTYQYQGELRNYFRSTKAHNTVLVNNTEQSEYWGEHRIARRVSIGDVIFDEINCSVSAVCFNYRGMEHRRKLQIAEKNVICIQDQIEAKKIKNVRSFYHLHPHYFCGREEENLNIIKVYSKLTDKNELNIIVDENSEIIIHNQNDSEWCNYSEIFGKLEYGITIEVVWKREISNNCLYIKYLGN